MWEAVGMRSLRVCGEMRFVWMGWKIWRSGGPHSESNKESIFFFFFYKRKRKNSERTDSKLSGDWSLRLNGGSDIPLIILTPLCQPESFMGFLTFSGEWWKICRGPTCVTTESVKMQYEFQTGSRSDSFHLPSIFLVVLRKVDRIADQSSQ